MSCKHPTCCRTGGFYSLEDTPRLRYCAQHKPNETYKTYKDFQREQELCDEGKDATAEKSADKRPRVDPDVDEDGWITVKHLVKE